MVKSTLVEKVAVGLQNGIVFYLRTSIYDDDAGQSLEGLSDKLEGQLGFFEF